MNSKPLSIICIIIAICALLFIVEAGSSTPHYVLEPAVVRKVVKNPSWGFIGADEMTLIRFEDGYDTEVAGNRGEPGDKIMAYRLRGTKTIFGIMDIK